MHLSVVRNLEVEGGIRAKDYIFANCTDALIFSTRESLWDFAISDLSRFNSQDLFVELGVANGYSINYFAKRIKPKTAYGFDGFIGLKEKWPGTSLQIGTFNREGILPKVESNVTLIKGWFENTLASFLADSKKKIGFIHIDCDTYESTKYVLDVIAPFMGENSLILFDDFFGYPFWEYGQSKAFLEWQMCSEFRYIGLSNQEVLLSRKTHF